MARSRVATRAAQILTFLTANPDRPFTYDELCRRLGLTIGATTKRAVSRAAERAALMGLYITVPVHDNGYTLTLTTMNAQMAVEPRIWLGRVRRGITRRIDQADAFIEAHPASLVDERDRRLAADLSSARQVARLAADMERRALEVYASTTP